MRSWNKNSVLVIELCLLSTAGGCALLYNYDGYEGGTGGTGGTMGSVASGSSMGGTGGTGAFGGTGGTGAFGGTGGTGGATGGACGEATAGIFTSPAWARSVSGPGAQEVNQVAISPQGASPGEILLVGTSDDAFTFLGEPFSAPTSPASLFAARLKADGTKIWSYFGLFSAVSPECAARASGIASDGGSAVFLAGGCFGNSDSYGFAARVELDGMLLNETWSDVTDSVDMSMGDEMLTGVAVDGTGAPQFIGRASTHSIQLGAVVQEDDSKQKEIAVISCTDPSCAAPTVALLGGPGKEEATALALPQVGIDKDVLLTGSYTEAWPGEDMPAPPIPGSGTPSSGIFVRRHSAGSAGWTTGFVGDASSIPDACDSAYGEPRGMAIAGAPNGDVFVTGWICYPTRFGVPPGNNVLSPHAGKADVFLARLNGMTGELIWVKTFGDGAEQIGTGIAVDPESGHIFLSGLFTGTLDLGSNLPLFASGAGTQDIFVAELDEYGCLLHASRFGESDQPLELWPVRIAADEASVVIGGTWTGTLSFGEGEILTPGTPSGYVARFARMIR